MFGTVFTGLWAALLAKEFDPSLELVLIEARESGHGASGRSGLFDPQVVLVDPARLALGLRQACLQNGVRLFKRTQFTGLGEDSRGITVRIQYGQVRSKKVVLATNTFPPLLKRLRHYISNANYNGVDIQGLAHKPVYLL